MPRSTVPAFLRDPLQRTELAAELHTLADDIEHADDGELSRRDRARVARLRCWATETEEYDR